MAYFSAATGYWMNPLHSDGSKQMALDEALLEWVRHQPMPVIIGRTYTWKPTTLSFGVHQSDKSIQRACEAYTPTHYPALVRRPTGGRAILHGTDVSFAWITNLPELLKLPLIDSYCKLMEPVRHAMDHLGIPLRRACHSGGRDYLASSLCFETQTPSDLTTLDGHKVAGAAQLRRHGGLLQHGAAFVQPFGVSANALDRMLRMVFNEELGKASTMLEPDDEEDIYALWQALISHYKAEAERLLTTSGSHLLPASV
jgi:lipoate-protein ligase A